MIAVLVAVASLPPLEHDPARVRATADEILASGRYDPPSRSVAERISDWLGDRLADLLGALGGAGGNLVGVVLAWALLGVAVAVVAFVVTRRVHLGPVARVASSDAPVMVEVTRTPSQWKALAVDHESVGRWAEGLRCRHRALVAELVGAGVIAERAGRTAGEHVRDVSAARPAVAPAFAAATEAFEAVWYGGASADAASARRFAQLDAQVLAGLTGLADSTDGVEGLDARAGAAP